MPGGGGGGSPRGAGAAPGGGKRGRAACEPHAIGDLLASFIATTPAGRALAREALEEGWREAVGPEVASATRVRGMRDGVLGVDVASSALLQELSTFYRSSILAALKKSTGALREVRDVSFKLGALDVGKTETRDVRTERK